jgi:peptidoglycan LD-endopeptidase CwlK
MQTTKTPPSWTLKRALVGTQSPLILQKSLVLVSVKHWDFFGKIQMGHLIVLDTIAVEINAIFASLYQAKFPIAQIIPLVQYRWDDQKAILANNTSGFNYRSLTGFPDLLSWHALGLAIDINPLQNPATMPNANGGIYKTPGRYEKAKPGTILADGPVVRAFLKHGWDWGGSYTGDKKDYQHFEKPLKDEKRLARLLGTTS